MENKKYKLTIYKYDVYESSAKFKPIKFNTYEEIIEAEEKYNGYYYQIDKIENKQNISSGVLNYQLNAVINKFESVGGI